MAVDTQQEDPEPGSEPDSNSDTEPGTGEELGTPMDSEAQPDTASEPAFRTEPKPAKKPATRASSGKRRPAAPSDKTPQTKTKSAAKLTAAAVTPEPPSVELLPPPASPWPSRVWAWLKTPANQHTLLFLGTAISAVVAFLGTYGVFHKSGDISPPSVGAPVAAQAVSTEPPTAPALSVVAAAPSLGKLVFSQGGVDSRVLSYKGKFWVQSLQLQVDKAHVYANFQTGTDIPGCTHLPPLAGPYLNIKLLDKDGREFFQIPNVDVLAAPDTATHVQRTIDVTQKVGLDLANRAVWVSAFVPGDSACGN